MDFYTYSEIEKILLIAIKMPTVKIRTIALETGLNERNLYNWTCGRHHISLKIADILIEWFRDCRPDVL